MKRYYWEGYSGLNQYDFVNRALPLINGFGDILSINRFSDLALGLLIEIDTSRINELYRALSAHLPISGYEGVDTGSDAGAYLSLSITFIEGTGDAKIEVPAVPG